MSRLTGSGITRAIACPASYALPAVADPPSSDAQAGTDGHAAIERYLRHGGGRDAAVAALGADPADYAAGAEAEVAYAYSPGLDTARRLELAAPRAYVVADHEIPLTVDAVRIDAGAVRIVDWKLGRQQIGADAWQLTLAALAVSRARDVESVEVAIVQRQDDGPPAVRERTLDALDLAAAAVKIARAWDAVVAARATVAAGRVPDVTRGDHCTYCPAWRACPATIALARGALEMPAADVAARVAALSPAEAGALYERHAAGAKLLDEIKRALSEYAAREPLELPDGRRVELVTINAERPEMAPTGNRVPYSYVKLQVKGKRNGQ